MTAPAGVTVVRCGARACPHTAAGPAGWDAELRATVRATPHAILVAVTCVLGGHCTGTAAAGPHVVVQPCDVERRPCGPAALLGPVHEPADVGELCAWVGDAAAPAPSHLVAGVVTGG